jgi:pyruvate/2-oxoglutarate dehydrogenase complex dihydrolipoamide acyltransferase (E2) component
VIASVTRLPMITNRKLVVLVDPATNQYQIDWERSALVGGLMPAQFTLADDNKTYDLSGQSGPLMEILQILKANGIALNNMIDIRSNPAARQQVMAVVRRAAAAQQAPAAPAPAPAGVPAAAAPSPAASFMPPPPPEPSAAQRLQELETLRATGIISDAEYTTKRQQILSDL